MFGFGYLLAPRIAEMAQARMGDFQYREGRWWWSVVGKGSKLASIPVPPDMLVLLADWRGARGLEALPDSDDDHPLLCRLDGKTEVTDNQLYRLMKEAFCQAANDLAQKGAGEGQVGIAAMTRQLAKASPHWLRHTAITHQAQAGVELRYLARTARHARLDTTARYLHAEAEEWQRQVAAHRLNIPVRADDTGAESL
ncbi:tyrosine-type recombinase/integrase [Modicisalibacter luteus]|uniref:Tyrosine-type recombinase/integrase n=1 Tax=Modicisalibacter luteus TaxID=453962 RepID=A0ABV7M3F9_9GAMM|nr:site-specific integrase [Halomonas lutea]GHA86756.1 hypothetical protein GCM10007159_04930 [Halomonas lutea]